jgi:hypothetical protein
MDKNTTTSVIDKEVDSFYIEKAYELISGARSVPPYYIRLTREGAEKGVFTGKAIMVCAYLLQELDEEID